MKKLIVAALLVLAAGSMALAGALTGPNAQRVQPPTSQLDRIELQLMSLSDAVARLDRELTGAIDEVDQRLGHELIEVHGQLDMLQGDFDALQDGLALRGLP